MPKPTKKLKPNPEFRSHEEAGEFWMTHDTTEYLELEQGPARPVPQAAAVNHDDFTSAAPGHAGRAAYPREPAGCSVPEPLESVPG